MRARIPALPAGRRRRSSRFPPPVFPRSKSPVAAEESARVPVLLVDMSLCYQLLRQLVPGLPPGRAASRVEILQRVINYILDLRTVLDRETRDPQLCDPPRRRQQRQQSV